MREKAPAYLAGAAAATSTVSIAASQILLGAAILALLLDSRKLRWPPVTLPLLLFMGWTLLSLAASPDPRAGLPQIKKFYEYFMLFVVFGALRTLREVRWLVTGLITGATLSALWALGQFVRIYRNTPDLFYYVYSNGARVTGFMSHWMTFSGITMMAILLALALLLFDRRSWTIVSALAILAAALLAGYQRTMYAGAAAGAMWLLWCRKKWLIVLVPVAAALLLTVPLVRDRVLSAFQPQLNIVNSTAHRAALRATGWEMIKAHPLLGVGPERVKTVFLEYAPPHVPHPIPTEWSIGHLHNIYYQYAAERGVPAILALLWFLGTALYDFWRALRTTVNGRWMLQAAIACILAMMCAGLAEHNLNDSEPLGVFLSIIACGYVVRDAAQTS
jgi:O-antigen ligase